MRASNQAKNKIQNRNLVLKQIIINKSISRTILTKFTGLSKMTVTNIVNELMTDGLVTESSEVVRNNVGRSSSLLTPHTQNTIIGIYINRDCVEILAGNLCSEIYETITTSLKNETATTLCRKIKSGIDVLIKKYSGVCGIGISVIGPVNSDKGIILNPPNFFDIKNLNIKEFLEEAFGLPVYVDTDMNTSAIAEKYWGYAKDIPDYIYLGAASGLGAGIVNNYKLINAIGEIGHISVDLNGPKCHCGNVGCLEMYASIPDSLSPDETETKCTYLAHGIVTLINLFNPDTVFLGHRIPLIGDDAPQKIKSLICDKYISRSLNDVKICFSKFGMHSPEYGALAVFIEKHTF